MILWVNTNAQSPQAALVTGLRDATPEIPRAFIFGDLLELTIYLVDGTGAYDPRGGNPSNTLRVAFGIPGHIPVAYQTAWTPVQGGWTGKINLNTPDALALVLEAGGSVPLVMEIELSEPGDVRTTLVQVDTTLRNELIPESTPTPAPGETHIPASEIKKRFVQNRSEVTEFVGDDGINSIPTMTEETLTLIAVVIGGTVFFYRLTFSTDETESPWTIRPNDYANPGNARAWKLVSATGGAAFNGYTHAQPSAAATWVVEHNFGYRPAGITVWVTHEGESKLADVEIVHIDNDSFEVLHRVARSGFARCI